MSGRFRRGFTLIELLVVVAILALLASVLSGVVLSSLEKGRRTHCAQNLRNLAAANGSHAANQETFVAAAEDIMTTNRKRWHGQRAGNRGAFDGRQGPLSTFLGDAQIRRCASFRPGRDFQAGFESANGGYGYNAVGVGSTSYLGGYTKTSALRGLRPAQVDTPAQTLMFADAAFAQPYGTPDHLTEYSFLEPVRSLKWGTTEEGAAAQPSLHFRHEGRVNAVWVDGHKSTEILNPRAASAQAAFQLGWFGDPADNAPFRPW